MQYVIFLPQGYRYKKCGFNSFETALKTKNKVYFISKINDSNGRKVFEFNDFVVG